MINIKIKKDKYWKEFKENNLTIWVKGYLYSHSIRDLIKICTKIKYDEVSSFINSINGHFALVVQRNDLSFIAVDKIRSIPLFFTKIKMIFI